MESQTTAMCALMASYGGKSAFESNEALRLATNVVERNTVFSDDMATSGHAVEFHVDKTDTDSVPDPDLADDSSENKGANNQNLDTRYESAHEEPTEILWKKQSAKWEAIALDYICDVVCIVHSFNKALLKNVCTNKQVRDGLASVLLEQLMTRYANFISQVVFILNVERSGTPQTLNHYFNENLEKR